MITEIQLRNYRGFSKHKIPLRSVSIIVGRNNSGKSTIIPSRFEAFVNLGESSWPHLRIHPIDKTDDSPPELSLLVRDGKYVAEAGWVGSGLQAWLETCWFLARCTRQSIIVLDEPDIFLHPDLQRKLFRLVTGHFEQVLIATHSSEILAEVNADAVLIIDKDSDESKFAETIPAVQSVINNIGGAHNLQLTRLWAARRCIFIEGDDLEFLSAFHEVIYPNSPLSLSSIPNISLGGFGNWKHAVGAAIGLRNAGDQSIKAYCILDSDYRTDQEHKEIQKEAKENGLSLHIWKRKEIENYVLVHEAISRVISRRSKANSPSPGEIKNQIEQFCNCIRDQVFDQVANEIGARDRKGVADANSKAREIIDKAWTSYDGMTSICSGKMITSHLSGWSQKNFNVSFSALAIAREMYLEEIPEEVVHVIATIEHLRELGG